MTMRDSWQTTNTETGEQYNTIYGTEDRRVYDPTHPLYDTLLPREHEMAKSLEAANKNRRAQLIEKPLDVVQWLALGISIVCIFVLVMMGVFMAIFQ